MFSTTKCGQCHKFLRHLHPSSVSYFLKKGKLKYVYQKFTIELLLTSSFSQTTYGNLAFLLVAITGVIMSHLTSI